MKLSEFELQPTNWGQ